MDFLKAIFIFKALSSLFQDEDEDEIRRTPRQTRRKRGPEPPAQRQITQRKPDPDRNAPPGNNIRLVGAASEEEAHYLTHLPPQNKKPEEPWNPGKVTRVKDMDRFGWLLLEGLLTFTIISPCIIGGLSLAVNSKEPPAGRTPIIPTPTTATIPIEFRKRVGEILNSGKEQCVPRPTGIPPAEVIRWVENQPPGVAIVYEKNNEICFRANPR